MPEEEKTTEETKITPEEAEERVSTAVSEVVPETPDGLLIEEDGDPFWVIQRVFWGIIKTAALLGLLLFLIWLVWRPGSMFSDNNEPRFEVDSGSVVTESVTAVTEEKTVEPTEPKGPGFWQRLFGGGQSPAEEENGSVVTPTVTPVEPEKVVPALDTTDPAGAEIAYELEAARVQLVRGIIPQSVNWLRRAKTIGEVSLAMVRQESPVVRSRQVESILAEADQLFIDSLNLQSQLQTELNYFLAEGQAANVRTEALEQQIAVALQALDPVPMENLVNQKIASQQEASFFLSNAKIRDTLLRNVQTFDALLRRQSIPLLNPATEIRAN